MRMREVPLVDATGIDTLEQLARVANKRGCRIIVSGLQEQPREALHRFGFLRRNHFPDSLHFRRFEHRHPDTLLLS